MSGQHLRAMIEAVRSGQLARLGFTRRVAGPGLAAPMAAQLLAITGAAAR